MPNHFKSDVSLAVHDFDINIFFFSRAPCLIICYLRAWRVRWMTEWQKERPVFLELTNCIQSDSTTINEKVTLDYSSGLWKCATPRTLVLSIISIN